MKFKKIADTHVQVTTADGTVYDFKKREDIPLTRWLASMPYQVQDELKITFNTLYDFTDRFTELAQKDTIGKAELQNELARLAGMLREKVRIAEDIETVRLQLASVFWILHGEDETTLDPLVMAKKVEIMKANRAAHAFFFGNPIPIELSEITVTADTVLFLAQMKAVHRAMNMQPAT